MMDLTNKTKEFVCECTFTNANKDRYYLKDVIIDGRTYTKHGTATATTAVCFQYKITDPSTNHNEYLVLMGVARQNPGDTAINIEQGYEIASENAMVSPVASFTFPYECSRSTMVRLMRTYIDELPVKFIKTRQELANENKDINSYDRNTRIAGRGYYEQYYKDFKKYFKKYR